MHLRLLIAALGISLACAGCSTGGQPAASPAAIDWQQLLPPLPPAAPALPLPREDSAFIHLALSGDQSYERADNAVPDAGSGQMSLEPAAAEAAWAIYEFAAVNLNAIDSMLTIEHSAAESGTLYAALSDYQNSRWELHELAASAEPAESEFTIDREHLYTSAVPGSFYVALLAWDGLEASIHGLRLDVGIFLAAPDFLAANDGDYYDHIEIGWAPVVAATGYRLEYKQTGEPTSAFELVAEIEGGENTSHSHMRGSGPGGEPLVNVSYDYRACGMYGDTELGFWSEVDSGMRLIPPPQDLTATDATYGDRIELSWTFASDIETYRIYYKPASAGEESWALLSDYDDNVDGPLPWSHTYQAPLGHEAEYGTIYDYRVTTDFDGDESAPSEPDSGYRELKAPQTLIASYNLYPDKISLSWDAVAGAGYYLIRRSDDGISYVQVDTTTATTWDDTTRPAYDDYYYKVAAGLSGDVGDDSGAALGSLLGWDLSIVYDSATISPYCDIFEIDDVLHVVFDAEDAGKLLLGRAKVTQPAGPSDWQLSDVNNGYRYEGVTLGQLDGMPAVSYVDDDYHQLRFSLADGYAAETGYTFVTTTVVSTGDEVRSPQWRNFSGYPCLSWRQHGTEGNIWFAYSFDQAPQENTDWNSYAVDSVSTTETGHSLISGPSHPRIAYTAMNDIALSIAVSNVGLPTTGANWGLSTITSSVANPGPLSLTAVAGKPVVCYQYVYMVNATTLAALRALNNAPAGPGDWVNCGGISGQSEPDIGSYFEVEGVSGYPAVCFFRDDTQDLAYAQATTQQPSSELDWSVMTLAETGHVGSYCKLADYGGLPAIVYWDVNADNLMLARGL